MKNKGYTSTALSFQRKTVRASVSVTSDSNAIHCITEIDVSYPLLRLEELSKKVGERQSFTSFIVASFAKTIEKYPHFNSFIKGNRHIVLDDITISVLVERELNDEIVPEPVGVEQCQLKNFDQIQQDIRNAQSTEDKSFGSLSNSRWINFIPSFLLKTFIRIANSNISLAKKYGKLAVTAVGMFGSENMWFIPHGSATVLLTVGSMKDMVVEEEGSFITKKFLNLTVSFDHDIIDGAPGARFMSHLEEIISSAAVLPD